MSADDPGPTPLDQPYDEHYFKETYGFDGLQRFGMHWWSVRWYALMAERCLREIGGRRVLEIGCGHGFMLSRLEQRFETYGVDVSTYAIAQAQRFAPGSTCAVSDIEAGLPAGLAPGSFDLVVARYVFEHIGDPRKAMRHAVSMLRPGGMLLFSVPDTESIGARWKGDAWYAHQDPTHCSLLAPAEWRGIVDAAGLELVRQSADGYWDLPYLRWLPSWVQFPFFIGPSALACLSGRAILPAGFGENLLIFACLPGA